MSTPSYMTPPPQVPHSVPYVEQPLPQAQSVAQPLAQPQPQYQVPPGIAAQAAQQAVEMPPPGPAPVTEQLRQEAELPEWPAGAPRFRPVHAVPFRERAKVMKLWGSLVEKFQRMPRFQGRDLTGDIAEQYLDYLADASDFLEAVAVDKRDYLAWLESTEHDPTKFEQLFLAYMMRLNPGEANSSAS